MPIVSRPFEAGRDTYNIAHTYAIAIVDKSHLPPPYHARIMKSTDTLTKGCTAITSSSLSMQKNIAVDFLAKFPHTVIRYIDESKRGPIKTPLVYDPKEVPPTYGAYFSVNGFRNNSKEKKDLVSVNALHLDLDRINGQKITKEDVLSTFFDAGAVPSILVETKNGYHGYWLLKKPYNVNEATRAPVTDVVEGMNYTIAATIGADPSTADVSRVLRIPGTMHRKDINDQFEIRIVHEVDTRYTSEELRKVFPPTPRTKKKSNVSIEKAIGAKVGDRHKHLRDLAMSMIARGETPETALAILVGVNATFEKPKEQSELEMLVRTASDKKVTEKAKRTTTTNTHPDVEFLCRKTKDSEVPINCFENVVRAIRSLYDARFNEFKEEITIRAKASETWEQYRDNHINIIQSKLAVEYAFLVNAKRTDVQNAIVAVSYENAFDSAKEYVQSLTWDGVSRLDSWLHTAMHVSDNLYHKKIGANWVKGMVSRMLYPGCQFDHALILQGDQGLGKSSALIAIAGEDMYVEITELQKGKDFAEQLRGKVVIDFSEGAVFKKADQEAIKSQITNRSDTYRIPYERVSSDHKRRCVFALTSNPTEVLKDDTGNRRWWPVQVKEVIDVTWIRENREQLLAEAKHRVVTLKESMWEVPKHLIKEQHDALRVHEANEDAYIEWYYDLTNEERAAGVTTRDAYRAVFGISIRDDVRVSREMTKSTEMSIARIFKGPLELVRDPKSKVAKWIPADPLRDYPSVLKEDEESDIISHALANF